VKRLSFFLLAILSVSRCAFAQSIDVGRSGVNIPHPVDLILDVSVDQARNPAPAGLTVQIYDSQAMGSTSMNSGQTDARGSILFRASDGIYVVRISGADIVPYEGTIQIMRQESRHAEHITVRSKSSDASIQKAGPNDSSMVSSTRLRVPSKAQEEFQAGSKGLEKKDFAEAKKRFERAIAIYPDFDLAFNGLGVAQMSAGETTAAQGSFTKAVGLNDHFAEAYRNLARISLGDHKYEDVEDLLTKSLQTEPLNAWALTYAAYAELQIRKFELAITHARTAHSVPHPGLASAHVVAALALEATNQPQEALKEYRLYLEEDPNGRDAARAKQAVAKLETSPAP
jgi:Tfp pilus assembly protein PilF